jgi:uncharacterized protein YdhG (YjbR/CyaY superfamily)
MQSKAATVKQYIAELPPQRQKAIIALRKAVKKNLPKGFKEAMGYGMIGYCVPHSIYPKGYHCNPKQPLPFAGIASQKHFIAFYSMGVYSDNKLAKWFAAEYAKAGAGKPDMGKSCIRFKTPEKIPYALIGELCTKITVDAWISLYEKNIAHHKTVKKK